MVDLCRGHGRRLRGAEGERLLKGSGKLDHAKWLGSATAIAGSHRKPTLVLGIMLESLDQPFLDLPAVERRARDLSIFSLQMRGFKHVIGKQSEEFHFPPLKP